MLIHQLEYFENIKFNNSDFPFILFTSFGLTTHPHWHINSELMYVEKGELTLYINGEPKKCSKGDIFYLPQNYLHSVVTNCSCKYYVLVLGKDLLLSEKDDPILTPIKSIISGEIKTKPIQIQPGNRQHTLLLPIIESIITEDTTAKSFYKIMIKTYVIQLFSLLLRYNSDIQDSNLQPISSRLLDIKRTLDYVTNNYMNKITIESISKNFGLSEQHFSRLFKQFTGKTFIEHLTHYRLEQGKNLLLNTDLPVSRIPELTGFCNPCYFSRVYKNHYGISPTETRKKLMKQQSINI
ncbi:AraC family transcriptional regulator [Thiospirochaeta perfilievii]|uniref:AraC family transcriptional regulator n=1 Tax=Thiospirochaeta perfilievii TaxID=252967 RepID=A0A5C1Q9G8_9SPIO|nr:AraC family transcriptional regulator [Thiospirochaeta perfilievii]QEN03436.1 AraC family transcriptional regulator [Thiospirochaeta perfilievii]